MVFQDFRKFWTPTGTLTIGVSDEPALRQFGLRGRRDGAVSESQAVRSTHYEPWCTSEGGCFWFPLALFFDEQACLRGPPHPRFGGKGGRSLTPRCDRNSLRYIDDLGQNSQS